MGKTVYRGQCFPIQVDQTTPVVQSIDNDEEDDDFGDFGFAPPPPPPVEQPVRKGTVVIDWLR